MNCRCFTCYFQGGESYLNSLPDALDGQVIPDFDSSATSRESFFYYCSDRLMAVRYKDFKVHYHTMGDAGISRLYVV